MARPKDDRPLVRIAVPLSLRVGRDDDIIELLQGCENRPRLIIAALRGNYSVKTDEADDTDEYDDMFDELEF